MADYRQRSAGPLRDIDANCAYWRMPARRPTVPISARMLWNTVPAKIHLPSVFSVRPVWLLLSVCHWELQVSLSLCLFQRGLRWTPAPSPQSLGHFIYKQTAAIPVFWEQDFSLCSSEKKVCLDIDPFLYSFLITVL